MKKINYQLLLLGLFVFMGIFSVNALVSLNINIPTEYNYYSNFNWNNYISYSSTANLTLGYINISGEQKYILFNSSNAYKNTGWNFSIANPSYGIDYNNNSYYVIGYTSKNVSIYNSNGVNTLNFSVASQLTSPVGISVYNNTIYVLNQVTPCVIYLYNMSGSYLSQNITTNIDGNNIFIYGLAKDNQGNFYTGGLNSINSRQIIYKINSTNTSILLNTTTITGNSLTLTNATTFYNGAGQKFDNLGNILSNTTLSTSNGLTNDGTYFYVNNGGGLFIRYYNSIGYNNFSYNFSTSGNKTYNISVSDSLNSTNTSLNNIILINPFQYFYFYSSSLGFASNFSLGGLTFNTSYANITTYNSILTQGANLLGFTKIGYAATNVSFNLNTTSALNITTNVTTAIIYIYIYDRKTEALINTTTTYVSIVATTGYNTTTTTGIINLSNINFINEEYQLLVSNSLYNAETIYFNYNNQQNLNLSIYMINSTQTNAGYVTVKAIVGSDESLINGAYCYVMEWKPSQSAFVTVASGKTNSNGEVILNIELTTKLYKFSCTKSGYISYTTSQIITATGSVITVVLGNQLTTPVANYNNLNAYLTNTTLNSTYNTVRFVWNDGNNLVTQGCLAVYTSYLSIWTLNSTTCVASTNNYIVTNIFTNTTYSTKVTGYLVYNGQTIPIDSIIYSGSQSLSSVLNQYHLDIFVPIILFVLLFSLGFMLAPQTLLISFIGGIIGTWLGFLFVPSIVSVTLSLFISLIMAIMIWATWRFK